MLGGLLLFCKSDSKQLNNLSEAWPSLQKDGGRSTFLEPRSPTETFLGLGGSCPSGWGHGEERQV